MKIRPGIWLATVAVFFSGSAWPHIQRFSSSELVVRETEAVWTLQVHLSDFDQMFGGASEPDALRFLPKRLELRSEGHICRLENSNLEKDVSRETATIRLRYVCEGSGTSLKVYYGLFYGDPSHRHLFKYVNRGKTQNFTFTPSLTEKEFRAPSTWEEFKSFLRGMIQHLSQ
jgi:hypothetical protein